MTGTDEFARQVDSAHGIDRPPPVERSERYDAGPDTITGRWVVHDNDFGALVTPGLAEADARDVAKRLNAVETMRALIS